MARVNMRERHISIWHLIAGVIMAALGVYVWFNPAVSLMALALYLGIVFIIVGGGYLAASLSFQSGWYMVVGILDILVGAVLVANLGVTAVSLPIIFALWCLAVGVVQVVSAYRFGRDNLPWGWTLAAGIVGVLFGLVILSYPVIGSITLTALMGSYILLYGVIEIIEYTTNRKLLMSYSD